MSTQQSAPDWPAIEVLYRAGTLSTREIADQHGLSHTAINKRAKANAWHRDLNAKIRAKADALVSKAMVSTEVSKEAKATETMRVEVEAQVQARIRLTHRSDIGKYRALQMKLLVELEALTNETTGVRIKALKDLADVAKTLTALEREAYSLDDLPPVKDLTPADAPDIFDVAKRLAFVFASSTRTVQ